jgi:hypothetical protein
MHRLRSDGAHPPRSDQGDPLGHSPGAEAAGRHDAEATAGHKAAQDAPGCKKRIERKIGELFEHRYLLSRSN